MPRLEHKNMPFKSVMKKVKASFREFHWREAFTFCAFVLLASGFWLMQSLKQEYEIELSVPIRYRNIPPSIHFSEDRPEKLIIKVKDRGNVLLNYSLGRTLAPIEINMKNLPLDQKEKVLVSKQNIEADLLKQLISTTSLISFAPREIRVSYGKLISREVPVVFAGKVQPDAGFQVSDSIRITPATVKVYASQGAFDSISVLKTAYAEWKTNQRIVQKVKVIAPKGANVEPAEVTVTIPVEEYTEKTLSIPIICPDLPSQYTVRTFPSNVNVVCNIPMSRFKYLSDVDFGVSISFKDLKDNKSGLVDLTLFKKPDWVTDVTLSPNQIEFLLEQKTSPQPEKAGDETAPQE